MDLRPPLVPRTDSIVTLPPYEANAPEVVVLPRRSRFKLHFFVQSNLAKDYLRYLADAGAITLTRRGEGWLGVISKDVSQYRRVRVANEHIINAPLKSVSRVEVICESKAELKIALEELKRRAPDGAEVLMPPEIYRMESIDDL